ncbi:prestin isoform X2 [Cololabis saira]|uniref:prestin isoform X2 n=1 Tax=Cololabis saira TaxID=129043 RepID=UPI002AD2DF72|nr:prestin isoform X2 [Cololabis saira]
MEQEEEAAAAAAACREDEHSRPMYRLERPLYDETFLRTRLLHHKDGSTTFRQRLAEKFQCSSQRAKAVALSFLPILTWLPSYPVKQYLFSDVVSGLSTGVVQLPQGTFAVISLMIGGVAVREAPDSMFLLPANGSNMSVLVNEEERDARRVQVAVVLTTLVGIIQIVFGLLRFGFVAIYLTEPLVRGFTTAAAMHVVISQLKYLLGVKTQRFSGPLSAIYSVKAVLGEITNTNVTTFLLGLACLVFLYTVKVLNERYKKKLPVPIPGEIIVVIVSTGVSYGLSLSDDYKVDVVGNIPTGLRPPAVPEFSLLPSLVTDSFAVAIVGFSMGISLAKTFALKHGYSVEGNQELIALGLCNFISSFFQTFAITCSMSRSLVQESTGGKTQIAGLLASLVVLLVVVAIGFVFQPLPQTALAAIIMVNLVGMFKQFRDIPSLWKISKIELAIWIVAFLASVLLGLDYGLLVAITVALLSVIYRTQSPRSSILGHVPNTGLYYDVDEYEEATESEGIKIFQFTSSVYFANSDLYVNTLKEKTGLNPEQVQVARKRQRKQRKKVKSSHDAPLEVCAKYSDEAVTHEVWPEDREVHDGRNGELEDKCNEATSEVTTFLEPLTTIHFIILDWSTANFIDSVGAKAIKQVIKEYAAVNVKVVIAGCNRSLLAELDSLQFFSGDMTTDLAFPTLHDAVLHCQQSNSNSPVVPNEMV